MHPVRMANSGLFLFLLSGQPQIVTCSPHAHLHVLRNLMLEISLGIFWFGLPSAEFLESFNESLDAPRIFFHFNPSLDRWKI